MQQNNYYQTKYTVCALRLYANCYERQQKEIRPKSISAYLIWCGRVTAWACRLSIDTSQVVRSLRHHSSHQPWCSWCSSHLCTCPHAHAIVPPFSLLRFSSSTWECIHSMVVWAPFLFLCLRSDRILFMIGLADSCILSRGALSLSFVAFNITPWLSMYMWRSSSMCTFRSVSRAPQHSAA